MRDAIATGIALILLTFVMLITVVYALEYARGEGWLEPSADNGLFIDSPIPQGSEEARQQSSLFL